MKFTTYSIMFIVLVVLITGILVGNKPVNLTGASITYPSLTGYCRQTVDPFTGVGSFMCDSATQVTIIRRYPITWNAASLFFIIYLSSLGAANKHDQSNNCHYTDNC